MKRFFIGALAALFSVASLGATTVPSSLINWVAALPVANGGTGATSASTALSNLGGLSATTAASTYATITNLALKAPLASPTFTGTVTIPTGASITKPNIVGTATNDSAQAGSIGEFVTNSASAVTAFGSNTAGNVTSISLTAGDWDVQGTVVPASGTVTAVGVGISTTSATFGSLGTYASAVVSGSNGVAVSPTVRISVASTTTVYLVGNATYSVAPTMSGLIRARRIR